MFALCDSEFDNAVWPFKQLFVLSIKERMMLNWNNLGDRIQLKQAYQGNLELVFTASSAPKWNDDVALPITPRILPIYVEQVSLERKGYLVLKLTASCALNVNRFVCT